MNEQIPRGSISNHVLGPVKIAGIYLILGIAWILFSDQAATRIAPNQAVLTRISTYKGWGYVILTALLLYLLIRRYTVDIRKSEMHLHLLTDALPALISYVDSNKRYRFNNKAYRDWFGQDATGKSIEEVLGAEAHEKIFHHLETALAGQPVNYETKLPYREGGARFVNASYIPDVGEDGNVRGFFSLVQDVTEYKVSQEALERSERRYRLLFENMPSGFARCQMIYAENGEADDFMYLDVNDAFKNTTDLEDVIGRRVTDLIPDIRETNPELFEINGRVAKTGQPEKFESYLPNLGSGIWFSVTAYSPEPGFFVAIFEIITERKQAEKELQQAEARFRTLVEQLPAVTYSAALDETSSTLYVSPQIEELAGFSPDEYLANSDVWNELLHPEDRERVLEEVHQSRSEDEKFESEYRVVARDGKEVWVRDIAELVRDESGDPMFLQGLMLDITDRKRSEEQLKRSHKQLLSFIENAPLSVAMFDRNMNYLATSRQWVGEYGRGYTELIGHNYYEVNPDVPDHWKDAYQKGLAGESSRNYDDVWIQEDGTKIWLSWAINPWMDENEEIGGIIISTENISERKRAEAAAFQNEVRYHRVLDAMMEGCQIIDFDWQYVYVNDVVAEQGKHKPEELLGHTMMEMYPGIERTELFAVLQKCMADREPIRMENRFEFPDGSVGWFDLSIQPAQEGLFILSTDITERKRTEGEIRRLNEELEQRVIERTSQLEAANKELEAFSYSVSHDLRAPLRAIDGFTNILMEDYAPSLDEEGKRLCGVISRESKRMGKLIDDLLAFSRLGRREMNFTQVDMQAMVMSVFDELETDIADRKIDFQLIELPPLEGDEALMRQVWINLLANAIKFTSRKKRAIIEAGGTQSEDEIHYYVRDNGAGFDMEYVDKLFGVFQRLHSDHEFEGTGVGLAIVQRVIHRHGGRVWAEGQEGKGATFHFTVPKEGGKS